MGAHGQVIRTWRAGAREQRESQASKDSELMAFGNRLFRLPEKAGLTREPWLTQRDCTAPAWARSSAASANLAYKNVLKLARGLGLIRQI
jgi:hypothetical protein